jgi:dihydrofolate reductase
MKTSGAPAMLGAIVAMTQTNVIGLNGDMPWHYSEDLKRFKQTTLNSTIIMGRLTWESIGCRALPGRRNIVISRSPVQDVEHYDNLDTAIKSADNTIWIIGGGQIYKAIFPRLTLLDVTYVPDIIDSADAVKFPAIEPHQWQEVERTQLEDSELVNVSYQRK